MELLDLDDDAIIALFNFCDKESKLNLMATCRRFEFLIGNNLELYKEFELYLHGGQLEDHENRKGLLNFRRRFGTVLFSNLDCTCKEFEVVDAVLQIIGEKVVNLELEFCQLSVSSVAQILKRVSNISSLKLEFVDFVEKNSIASSPKLPKLKSLELEDYSDNNFIDHRIFNQLFSSTISLHDFTMRSYNVEKCNEEHWKIVQQIIATNPQLKSLSLHSFRCIKQFECPAETGMQLEKLELISFKIYEKSVVDNFTRFIKTQKNIKDLHIWYLEDEYRYNEVLTHLLNLKSLEKLEILFNINVQILEIMKMENPNLKWLKLNGEVDDRLFPFFPNIQILILSFIDIPLRDEFFVSINSLKYLRELSIKNISCVEIQQICLRNLEKLEIERFYYSGDDTSVAAWNQFTKNNSGIKHLTLSGCLGREIFLKHLECIMRNLTNLKSLHLDLNFRSEEIEIQAVEMIAKNCTDLEYVELRLKQEVAEKAAALFSKKSSMLKFKIN